jgi:phage terminase large subunit
MAKKLAPLPKELNLDIDTSVFNEVYLPLMWKIYEWIVLYGSAAAGKSFFAAQMLVIQLTYMPDRNCAFFRTQQTDCVQSCYPQMYKALEQFKIRDLWDITEHPVPHMVNRNNGNEIIFTGVDNIEDIKSITFKHGDLTDAVYEEVSSEPNIKVIREIRRRMRNPYQKSRIILIFNPVSRTHWLYDFVTRVLPKRDSFILKTTYKDNKWCPKSTIDDLNDLRFESPAEYAIYALGEWGTTGITVFNAELLNKRLLKLKELYSENPPQTIEFSYELDENGLPNKDSFEPFDNPDGETIIYKQPDAKVPYVLAFDTAGEGSDYYACHVMDNITKEQVATFHSVRNPDICVLQIYGLAMMYNEALVCPEINFDSYPLKMLQQLGYTNFYRRMVPDESIHETTEPKYGFRTTAQNRQRILSECVSWVAHHIDCINDVATIEEMMTFTRQERKQKGIFWAAEAGAHDDMVMSWAILLQACSQQFCEVQPEKKKIEGFWTRSELEVAVEKGKIDNEVVREYMLKYENRFKKQVRRKSRYGR